MNIWEYFVKDTLSLIQIGIILFWLILLDKFLSRFSKFIFKMQRSSKKGSEISDND